MINKVELYAIDCDGCNVPLISGNDCSAWYEKESAEEYAIESDWHRTKDGKHYCPDCIGINGNTIIKGEQP